MDDISELALHRGEVGVIRSTWFGPSIAYEVEFCQTGLTHAVRVLLLRDQLEVEVGSLFCKREGG